MNELRTAAGAQRPGHAANRLRRWTRKPLAGRGAGFFGSARLLFSSLRRGRSIIFSRTTSPGAADRDGADRQADPDHDDAFFGFLVFSNIVTAISSYYVRRPRPADGPAGARSQLHQLKYLETLAESSWMIASSPCAANSVGWFSGRERRFYLSVS